MSERTQDQRVIEALTKFIVAAHRAMVYARREDAVGSARYKVAIEEMDDAREEAMSLGYLWPVAGREEDYL